MIGGTSFENIIEPAREVKICRKADVVVVGGGPGGHSAAVAAARNGADTVLVERYGHLGGMATGGLVVLIPHLSDGTEEQQIAGLCQEWLDRLDVRDAVVHPKKEELGSTDEKIVQYWQSFSNMFVCEGRVQLNAIVDPEILKCVLNEMVKEAGVKTYLHSWGAAAVIEGNEVKGVIFESKSGRQAILGKVIIDATGDGDLLPSAGAEFDANIDPSLRIRNLAVVFQIGNVDVRKADDFKEAQSQKFAELMNELKNLGGYPLRGGKMYHDARLQNSVVLFNNFNPCTSQIDVEELTRVEFEVREKMLLTYDFLKKHVPGFEDSFVMVTAPQLGTRGARRVIGEYMVTEEDMLKGTVFEDTIAVCPVHHHVVSPEHPHVHIPYRSLVPRNVDNLLVGCRAFSSEDVVNNDYNLIPHCIAIGEAAGTAAAMAVEADIKPRKVDHSTLQARLIKQGVPLPGTVVKY
jgi:hypothetical protein